MATETEDICAEFGEASLVASEGNSVYFYAPVSNASVLMLNKKLREVATRLQHHRDAIIYVFINSCGGDLYAGLSAMDHIASFPIPIYTVVDGLAASAATFIALAGKKRFIMKNAHILVHQLSTSFWGKYEEMVDEFKTSKRLMRLVKKIYKEKTQLDDEHLDKILGRETTLGAKKAIQYGFVDELYT